MVRTCGTVISMVKTERPRRTFSRPLTEDGSGAAVTLAPSAGSMVMTLVLYESPWAPFNTYNNYVLSTELGGLLFGALLDGLHPGAEVHRGVDERDVREGLR